MKTYDIVIAGGGPAGASLGYGLIQAGYRCVIVDKAVFPRKKLCGGLLTVKTVELLESMYGEPFSCYEAVTDEIRIFDKKGKLRQKAVSAAPFYLVDRERFDQWLLDQYKELGGETIEGNGVSRIDQEASVVYLKDGTRLGYQYLVGADGANSQVRRCLDSDYRPEGFCLEVNPECAWEESAISVYVGIANQGYGWVFPKGRTVAAGMGGALKNNGDITRRFQIYRKRLSLFSEKERPEGAFVPYGSFVKKPAKGQVLLIGDAAGLAEPLTGEGIYFALLSSRCACQAITMDQKPDEGYMRRIRPIHRWIRQAEWAKRIFFMDFICFVGMGILQMDRKLTVYALEHAIGRSDTTYWNILFAYGAARIRGIYET